MKKTLLMLLLVMACGGATAQKAYQKLTTFKGDTVAYMKANFEDNKARYIGYKFEKLLTDYELPFMESYTSGTSPWAASQGGKSYLSGFTLSYLSFFQLSIYSERHKRYANVYVTFQKPYTEDYMSLKLRDVGYDKAAIIRRFGGYIVEKIEVIVRN